MVPRPPLVVSLANSGGCCVGVEGCGGSRGTQAGETQVAPSLLGKGNLQGHLRSHLGGGDRGPKHLDGHPRAMVTTVPLRSHLNCVDNSGATWKIRRFDVGQS